MSDTTRLAHLNIVEILPRDALEWAIQRWMLTTGQQVRVEDTPWLAGPISKERIGAGFYEEYAQEAGLEIVTDDPDAGLLPEFDALAGGAFDPLLVRPEIRDFYERTARHGLDVRPHVEQGVQVSAENPDLPGQPQHPAVEPAHLAIRGRCRDVERADPAVGPGHQSNPFHRLAQALGRHRSGDLRGFLHDLRATGPRRQVRQGRLPAARRLGDGGATP
ncbi:MAG: hypothetical protein H0U04_12590 [Rubrobacter sp.]|nr:hypothetical protein [Rubrobacter sp.]